MEWNSPEVSCIFLPLLSSYLSPLSSLLPPPFNIPALISLPDSLMFFFLSLNPPPTLQLMGKEIEQ